MSVSACVIWCIWKSRNGLIFEGKSARWDMMFEEVKAQVWSWISIIFSNICNYSYKEILNKPLEFFEKL